MNDHSAQEITKLIKNAKKVLILQADNPDGDSLGSALALESILGDLGKESVMYCAVQVPSYLRYIEGWDRVEDSVPINFDLSIYVDVSTDDLFERLNKTPEKNLISKKPSIIIDHHFVDKPIENVDVKYVKQASATAEIIYDLAKKLDWKLSRSASSAILSAILSDSLGLTSETTSARTIEIVYEIVKSGVTISEIDAKRKELSKKSPDLLHYKGELLERVEFHANNRIAIIAIPWKEIEQYSNEYNPSVLVIEDMRQTTGVELVVAFKIYKDGKITAKIRCNPGHAIADQLAKHFGGGGHPYAGGFKILSGMSYDQLKNETIKVALELLE